MTEQSLATLVRAHVDHDEPPFLMAADAAILAGRRALRRRRLRRGATGIVAAAVVAAVALPLATRDHGADRQGRIDPATTYALEHYDAQAMAERLQTAAGDTFARWAAGPIGLAEFTAADSQEVSLPRKYYDKASSMEVVFGDGSTHQYRLYLAHSRSEAEGNAVKGCHEEVQSGYAFSCEVSTSPAGDTVTTTVDAVRRVDTGAGRTTWGTVTRDELRTGVPNQTDPSRTPIDPAEVYFKRTVKVVHSETFLSVAQELVKAPSLASATPLWVVPTSALEDLATDPTLVIPSPPIADNGCAWMLHPEGMSCSTSK